MKFWLTTDSEDPMSAQTADALLERTVPAIHAEVDQLMMALPPGLSPEARRMVVVDFRDAYFSYIASYVEVRLRDQLRTTTAQPA